MKSRIILIVAIVAIWLGYLSSAVALVQYPLTVTNIAELKSLSVSFAQLIEPATPSGCVSPTVYVLGYYTPGDRGGGMFEWDPNASSASDGEFILLRTVGCPATAAGYAGPTGKR